MRMVFLIYAIPVLVYALVRIITRLVWSDLIVWWMFMGIAFLPVVIYFTMKRTKIYRSTPEKIPVLALCVICFVYMLVDYTSWFYGFALPIYFLLMRMFILKPTEYTVKATLITITQYIGCAICFLFVSEFLGGWKLVHTLPIQIVSALIVSVVTIVNDLIHSKKQNSN